MMDSMDNWTLKADLAAKIEEIKRCMPATYASIKDKATVIGNEAFTWVRRGEPVTMIEVLSWQVAPGHDRGLDAGWHRPA